MGVRSMVKVKCRNLLLRDKTREQLLTGFNIAYFGQSLTTVYGRFYKQTLCQTEREKWEQFWNQLWK